MVDAVVGLGIALVHAGAVTRPEIAAALSEVLRQLQARAASLARQSAALALQAFFAAPVAGERPRHFTVLNGGKGDDESPRAA